MTKEPDWKRVADSYRDDLANVILVGNRLARGEVTAAEWHEAVRAATAAEAPICVLRSRDVVATAEDEDANDYHED